MAYLTINGKLASPALSRPCAYGYKVGKYGLTVGVPKKNTTEISRINLAIDQAIREKWGENPPACVRRPLKDGDSPYSPDAKLAGCYYLEIYGKYQPFIFDQHGEHTCVFDEKLNGRMCPCTCMLVIKAYDVNGGVGVTCYPKGVMINEGGAWIDNTVYPIEDLLKSIEAKFTY